MKQSTYGYNPKEYAKRNLSLQDVLILSVGIHDNDPKAFDQILGMAKDIPSRATIYQTILHQMLNKSVSEGFVFCEIENGKSTYSLSDKGLERYNEIALELLNYAFYM